MLGASHSHTVRHRIRRKEKYTKIEKGESPEAKNRLNYLRKDG